MHTMIDFYVASAVSARRIMATTAPQIAEKLERVFGILESAYRVQMQDEQIIGLDSKTLQMWFNQVSMQWKPATVNAYVSVINPFLRWAHNMANGDIPYLKYDLSQILHTVRIPSPDDLPEEERPKNKYYTEEQVNELLNGVHGRNVIRDRAIIGLFLGSGIRVSELCSLTIGQLMDVPHGTVRLLRKGGAWKDTEVADYVYPLVEAYLETRDDVKHRDHPLFMTTHGKPCSREQIYKCLSYKQKELGLATGPHALRHTALSALEKESSPSVARDIANHKSFLVTNRYVHSGHAERSQAINSLPWARKTQAE